MQSWEEWKEKNKDNLRHIAGFEERFVDLILSRINEINPEDVVSQYHFVDTHGQNRYIDFVIKNEEKNYFLPIELDGYSKMQMGYNKFNDFLIRQNALLAQFSIVLRYSNKQMLYQSSMVIGEIRKVLDLQQKGEVGAKVKQEIHQRQVNQYRKEIETLKEKEQKYIAETEEKLAALTKKIADSEQEKEQYSAKIARYQEELARLGNPSTQKDKEIPAKLEALLEKITQGQQEQAAYQDEIKQYREEVARLRLSMQEAVARQDRSQTERRVKAAYMADRADRVASSPPPSQQQTAAYGALPKHGPSLGQGILWSVLVVSIFAVGAVVAVKWLTPSKASVETPSLPQTAQIVAVAEPTMPAQVLPPATQQEARSEVVSSAKIQRSVQPKEDEVLSISSASASQHIGEYATVCGQVAQLKEFRKGVYVNFDQNYPQQTFTAVIWNKSQKLIEQAPRWYKKRLCITGKIADYKGKPQMTLHSSAQVK